MSTLLSTLGFRGRRVLSVEAKQAILKTYNLTLKGIQDKVQKGKTEAEWEPIPIFYA